MMTQVKWNADGLIAAVAQDARTREVLMLAWMNQEALHATLTTGMAHYYSRSRRELWKKGETSGHLQFVESIRLDCDGDSLLLLIRQTDLACHTGRRSCFYRELSVDGTSELADPGPIAPDTAPLDMLDQVYRVILARKGATAHGSYVKSLFDKGLDKILSKVAEEAGEVDDAFRKGDFEHIRHELADLVFHLLVAQASIDLPPDTVRQELQRRFGVSGHDEKASRQG